MAIKMVREPSETPNINNIDDIVPMRYAYGNQNGYVIGKGNEISNTVNGLNFTVNSGRLVLQGVECDIDAVGVTITIDNIATTRYYVVYLQVNLGLNTAQILSSYDTATYPTIDAGDDLTENTTGVARLPLYRFTATSGIISEVNKVVESIKYTSNMSVANANLVQNVNFSSSNSATFGDYIVPKIIILYNTVLEVTSDIVTLSDNLSNGDLIRIKFSKSPSNNSNPATFYQYISIQEGENFISIPQVQDNYKSVDIFTIYFNWSSANPNQIDFSGVVSGDVQESGIFYGSSIARIYQIAKVIE